MCVCGGGGGGGWGWRAYVAIVLLFFILNLSFFWCLEKTVLHDCGIFLVSSLIFWPARKKGIPIQCSSYD